MPALMNKESYGNSIVNIPPLLSACDRDKQPRNTLAKRRHSKPSAEVNPVRKCKKNIPKNIYIITADKDGSREVIAKAMAEMYRRMLNPV